MATPRTDPSLLVNVLRDGEPATLVKCPVHARPLECLCCVAAARGRKGGARRTPAQVAAARRNGARGGRPRIARPAPHPR